MSKLDIFPGEWYTRLKYDIYASGYYVGTTRDTHGAGNEFDEAHATLIADAGTTYSRTGMLPSEMAELIQQLVDALAFERDSVVSCVESNVALSAAASAGFTPTPNDNE